MTKQELRAMAKDARKAVENREQKSAQACDRALALDCYKAAKVIFSYCAFGTELDVSAIDEKAMADGKTLCYPICDGKGEMMAAVCREGAFCTDMYGIRCPDVQKAAVIDPADIDLILVPAVAFDENAARLGYGAGYYDRYIPKCKNAKTLGMAFDEQIIPDACAQPHDCRMDIIVTPTDIRLERA